MFNGVHDSNGIQWCSKHKGFKSIG
ncbi:hypothetical protein ACFX2I_013226 [Malus domestica]